MGMLGRVYTFERDASEFAPSCELVSNAAVGAVLAAINGRSGIRFEVLTDADNPKPVIAVLFSNPLSMAYFDGLLEATLRISGIRARVMHAGRVPAMADQETGSARAA